jgi:hypothetical protein
VRGGGLHMEHSREVFKEMLDKLDKNETSTAFIFAILEILEQKKVCTKTEFGMALTNKIKIIADRK